MKKHILKALIIFIVLILAPKENAQSIFVSSSNVYVGDSFSAGFTLTTAAWDVSMTATGPVSGCSFHEVSDSGTGYNTTKKFSANCTATGIGTINISISGNHTPDTSDYSQPVSGNATVNVTERPYTPPSGGGGGNYTPQPATPKNTNNFLKSLEVTNCTLNPKFDKNELNYSCKELTVDKVEIKATAEESKSTVNGTGVKNLVSGDNKFEISVVSESGDVRKYTITVSKKNIPTTKINKIVVDKADIEINSETTIIGVKKGTTKIDIKAISDSTSAKVKIAGNENLKPGLNLVEINVSDVNCKEKTYYVIVYVPELETLTKPITKLDENNIINLEKNSSYILSKDVLGMIKDKLTYNIVNKYNGVIASLEINRSKILEEDYDLFFIFNKNKVYTNIFHGTKVKVFLNNGYKLGEKIYIYEIVDNKYKLLNQMKIENMYAEFETTESNEYLITTDNKSTSKKMVNNSSAFTENFMIALLVILLLLVLFLIIKKGNKKNKKQKSNKEEQQTNITQDTQIVATTQEETTVTTTVENNTEILTEENDKNV